MKERINHQNIQELIVISSPLIFVIIISLMGKKQKKVLDNEDSKESGNSAMKEGDKKQQYFECQCGKKYGSLAAVHTHINNKHKDDKKTFKQNIKNPKKNGQGPSTSIRMKDINYNEQEADLMCMADTTVKNIFDYIKKHDEETRQKTQFLLDENAIDSSDQLDEDEDIEIEPRPNGARDQDIQRRVETLKDKYDITFIDAIIKDAREFQVFKLNKFNLTMIRELTKFFNPEFASRIQLELEIIATKDKITETEIIDQLSHIEKELWGDKRSICQIMEFYYKTWGELRRKEYRNNSR